jgi:hypothetical protein
MEAPMTTMEERIPAPPRLRPTWTTWMWVGFMVAVIVLTIIGLFSSNIH